ncbi:Bro-N domain-containing protein, partial [Acidithiobacillus sp. MC6.1]|nr:Bro-N domain-containing protein [Acidithiobacillus sp. MC6.1]
IGSVAYGTIGFQPFPLDVAACPVYAGSVTGVPVIGFGSPESRRTAAIPLWDAAFFTSVVWLCSYGRAGRGAARLAGAYCRSSNPFGSAHPFGRGLAVEQPHSRSLIMTTPIPQGAAAPEQALTPVSFQFNTLEVRTLDRDGQVWFVAGDVAKVLGYREAERLTRWLDDDESAPHNVGIRSDSGTLQSREVTLISESGLYHALLKSRKREAKPFRKWVTAEVLPAIRRSGGYAVPQDHTPSLVPPGTRLLLTFEANGR